MGGLYSAIWYLLRGTNIVAEGEEGVTVEQQTELSPETK